MTDVTLTALALHPVKSCRALPLDGARVEATGLAVDGARDREWMLVDAEGRFVTQREAPRMALVGTAIEDGGLALHLPGHGTLRPRASGASRDAVVWRSAVRGFDGGDEAANALSAFLGREVRLLRFDDALPRACNPEYVGTSGATTLYADGYPLLVVGQASLDELNRRLAGRGLAPVPMDRFRPNLVVDGLGPHDEDRIDTLAFGDLVLKPVKPCTRCVITTIDPDSAARSAEPMRTLLAYRRDATLGGVTFGMNAIVVAGAGGMLARGDRGRATLRA